MKTIIRNFTRNRLMMVISLSFIICQLSFSPVRAQKFALVDMEYIFKNIPAYERANEQLNQVSKKWQSQARRYRCQGERGCRPEKEILRS